MFDNDVNYSIFVSLVILVKHGKFQYAHPHTHTHKVMEELIMYYTVNGTSVKVTQHAA